MFSEDSELQIKTAEIRFTADAPRIDGDITDAVWQTAIPIVDFIQQDPDNLALPTENSRILLLYDRSSIYIAARLYDKNPDKIVRRMAKRDDWMVGFDGASDWFEVNIDSRFDHQTAFVFMVNAAGVKVDATVFDDSDYDAEWDTVWDAEVSIDDQGWTVEMEIPFSILRFTEREKMTWGIDFSRYIQRKDETITWMPKPRGMQGIASRFGRLTGLENVTGQSQFEVKPYVLGGITKYRDDSMAIVKGDFRSHKSIAHTETLKKLGLDIKYGLGSNSTMDVTINPDFGQVEADPAEINLTYFETRFMEKRPFFMENATIFDTPIEVFYSRRVGEDDAMIKGAAKVTGKTSNDISYGLLAAKTTPKTGGAWLDDFSDGRNTSFFTGRILKDVLEGNSYLGIMATHVRDVEGNHSAYSTDGFISALDSKLMTEYQIVGTDSHGEQGLGFYGELSYKHPRWYKAWVDLEYYDENFDIQHSGYNWRNDLKTFGTGFRVRRQDPWKFIRYAYVGLSYYHEKTMDNLNIGKQVSVDWHTTLQNFWRVGGGLNFTPSTYSDKTTYDWETGIVGPSVKLPETTGGYYYLKSDFRKRVRIAYTGGFGLNELNDEGWNHNVELQLRPTEYIDVSISRYFARSNETHHWLEIVQDPANEPRYMFSESENEREIYKFWGSSNVTRDISIQLYSEYFKNSNIFSHYQELSEGMQYPQFSGFDPYNVYPKPGELLDPNLDLNFFSRYTSLNGNLVLRWEYKPGSTIYAVYSVSKQVNGRRFSSIFDFIEYREATEWTEINYSQSLFIKVDYWFNL